MSDDLGFWVAHRRRVLASFEASMPEGHGARPSNVFEAVRAGAGSGWKAWVMCCRCGSLRCAAHIEERDRVDRSLEQRQVVMMERETFSSDASLALRPISCCRCVLLLE